MYINIEEPESPEKIYHFTDQQRPTVPKQILLSQKGKVKKFSTSQETMES